MEENRSVQEKGQEELKVQAPPKEQAQSVTSAQIYSPTNTPILEDYSSKPPVLKSNTKPLIPKSQKKEHEKQKEEESKKKNKQVKIMKRESKKEEEDKEKSYITPKKNKEKKESKLIEDIVDKKLKGFEERVVVRLSTILQKNSERSFNKIQELERKINTFPQILAEQLKGQKQQTHRDFNYFSKRIESEEAKFDSLMSFSQKYLQNMVSLSNKFSKMVHSQITQVTNASASIAQMLSVIKTQDEGADLGEEGMNPVKEKEKNDSDPVEKEIVFSRLEPHLNLEETSKNEIEEEKKIPGHKYTAEDFGAPKSDSSVSQIQKTSSNPFPSLPFDDPAYLYQGLENEKTYTNQKPTQANNPPQYNNMPQKQEPINDIFPSPFSYPMSMPMPMPNPRLPPQMMRSRFGNMNPYIFPPNYPVDPFMEMQKRKDQYSPEVQEMMNLQLGQILGAGQPVRHKMDQNKSGVSQMPPGFEHEVPKKKELPREEENKKVDPEIFNQALQYQNCEKAIRALATLKLNKDQIVQLLVLLPFRKKQEMPTNVSQETIIKACYCMTSFIKDYPELFSESNVARFHKMINLVSSNFPIRQLETLQKIRVLIKDWRFSDQGWDNKLKKIKSLIDTLIVNKKNVEIR